MTTHIYDLAIIGGGSAALSAGIYAGRSMMDTVIIEKDKIGGQATTTSSVVNYPGIRNGQGPAMMNEMRLQAEEFGTEFKTGEVVSAELAGDVKVLTDKNGVVYHARAVMIATGASPNKIGFPGEVEFTGRGIGYCSTCDGEFFTGLDIFVLGGGYAAAEEAVFLTRFAKKVHMIIREPDFTCAEMTANLAKNHPNIDITYNTEVKEISGDGLLSKAIFVNNQTGEETIFEADPADGSFGMFVFAGSKPNTDVFQGQVTMDGRGFIPTNDSMETNLPGVYGIGDLRVKELRQIVTAVADGAIAATKAESYVKAQKERLGVPIVHKEVKEQPKPATPQTEPAAQTVSGGQWFPAEMATQLSGIFSKLTKPVTIKTILDASEPKTMELSNFLTEFAGLSEMITLENYSRGDNPELEGAVGVERLPMAVLFDDQGAYTGIKFSGIPSGHELNSLVLAVYNVGSAGQALEEQQVTAIKGLPKTKIQICISLSCHYCPDVVAACQRIASLNPEIEAEMIDTALFPELKKEKKIMSVPAMIINDDDVIFGAKSLDEIISALTK